MKVKFDEERFKVILMEPGRGDWVHSMELQWGTEFIGYANTCSLVIFLNGYQSRHIHVLIVFSSCDSPALTRAALLNGTPEEITDGINNIIAEFELE